MKRIVEETVEATLIRLGVNADDPIEVQRDMSFLRDWRTSTAAVKRHGLFTAIGVLVVSGIGLIWLAIKGGTTP